MASPFDDFPTLDDLFNFLAKYSRAERRALPVIVRKGDGYFPIHDIRLSGASLAKGAVELVVDAAGAPRLPLHAPKAPAVACFEIG